MRRVGHDHGARVVSGHRPFAERYVAAGGTVLFGETSELTGGEHIVGDADAWPTRRCVTASGVFDELPSDHRGQGANLLGSQPTQGNIAGGLTTIEEKALGNIQKIGERQVARCARAGRGAERAGLHFMDTSSAAAESITLMAGGGRASSTCSPTGQGNIIGNPIVPVVKITANPNTAATMPEHIDIDVSEVITGHEPRRGGDGDRGARGADCLGSLGLGRSARASRVRPDPAAPHGLGRQTPEVLVESLRSGPATLADVAGLAGVHTSTASRALNERTRPKVSRSTVAAVLDAARELNYRPNSLARGLKMSRTFTVGMLIPDLTNPLFPPIVRGIEDRLRESGWTLIIANTDNDDIKERSLLDSMTARRVDGLILATARRDYPLLDEIIASGIPTVLVNRTTDEPTVPAVLGDDHSGIGQAVRHLAALGHTKIAHVGGTQAVSTASPATTASSPGCGPKGSTPTRRGSSSPGGSRRTVVPRHSRSCSTAAPTSRRSSAATTSSRSVSTR